MRKRQWKQQVISLSVAGLLGAPGIWVAWEAIAPPVQAYVSRANVTLEVQPGEAYSAFLSRAEAVARAAVQRSFDRDILISNVYVVVVGQRQGQTTPVLSVQVSRNQWRSRPDSRRWATYFPSSRVLLGFGTRPTSPGGPAPAAVPPSPVRPAVPPAIPQPSPTPEPESPLEQFLPQADPVQPGPNSPTPTTPLPPTGPAR